MVKPNIAARSPAVERPRWSVMIPTFEPDIDLLRSTVDSVFAAGLSPGDSQIAIVDDGSKGSSFYACLEQFRRRGIEVMLAPDRAGLAGNWNRCITAARSDWLHILHQDDRVRPGFYEALGHGLVAAPTAGAAFTQIAFIDRGGRETRLGHLPATDAGLLHDWVEHIVVNLVVQCPGIVVRRAVYERLGGFDDDYRYCIDADMWRRIAVDYPIWCDPRPLAEFREHPASAGARTVLAARWRERRRCLSTGLADLSPTMRAPAAASAGHYAARLALHELRQAWRHLSLSERVWALRAAPQAVSVRAARNILRGRYPEPLRSRAPDRAGLDQPRARRILVIADHFPSDPARAVFGMFQRLRAHSTVLADLGTVEGAFARAGGGSPVSPDARELLTRVWAFARLSPFIGFHERGGEARRHPFRSALWAARGAVALREMRATMQLTGRSQALQTRRVLAEAQPDLILAYRQPAMALLIRAAIPLPPVIFDIDDLEHIQILRRSATERSAWARVRGRIEARLARHAVARAVHRATATLVCSETDRDKVRALAPRAEVVVVPNSARIAAEVPLRPSRRALFVGIATYAPNAEAIRWLLSDIWPRVRADIGDAVVDIVGAGGDEVASTDPAAGVAIRGFVDDLSPLYAAAQLALCPVRRGGGTRIKIIEAAMAGRPVVSTTIGAEGLAFRPGDEILIADDAASFARACVELLTDHGRAARIGDAARRRALREYAPEAAGAQLAAVARPLLGAAAPP